MEFDPKTLKKPRYFLNFIINSKKTLCFSRFSTNIPKNLVFFWNSSKFQKNLGFSKIPKIFGEIDEFFGILEFWKTQCFFGVLKNSKNTIGFFGI